MITEDYCSYELSKLLKEKGFDEPCHGLNRIFFNEDEKPVMKVTHQMAMKWLREIHGLSVEPYSSSNSDKGVGFGFGICSMQTGLEVYGEGTFPVVPYNTYEEAVEAALKYSLENLI